MILLDAKGAKASETKSLNIPQDKDKKTTLSFSELLKGLKHLESKDNTDSKLIQNGTLVLKYSDTQEPKLAPNIEKNSQKEDFSSLLKNPKNEDDKTQLKTLETKNVTTKDNQALSNVAINPQVTEKMTPKELKALIFDAKKYLETQIKESEGYKKSQNKELPKTLKGLVEVAKNFGIDINKISFEAVKDSGAALKKVMSESKAEVKPEIKQDVKAEVKTEVKTEVKPEIKQDIKAEVKTEAKPEIKQDFKTDIKAEVKPEIKQDTKAEIKTEVKTEVKPELKQDVKKDIKPEQKNEVRIDPKSDLKPEAKVQTPLFKAHTPQVMATTEQTLQAREFKLTEASNHLKKTARERADETLKLLLRGEKVQKAETVGINMTSDFSVATAKVIAPSAKTESQNSLESLLRGENTEQSTTKQETTVATQKTDNLEVKINEAKQMTKYLSQDIRQAIENYKPPFTRIRVQLNPQNLGEVDLTVVQRGKNMHVNISSNNAAINALALNANDLKVQLTNSGIQNATLNFNSPSSDGGNNSQSHNQSHNQRHNDQARQEYNYFDNEEQNEEILSSLEIVVPNYA
jgi:hypothetical protein